MKVRSVKNSQSNDVKIQFQPYVFILGSAKAFVGRHFIRYVR